MDDLRLPKDGVEKKVFSSKMCVLNKNKNDHIILIKISILD